MHARRSRSWALGPIQAESDMEMMGTNRGLEKGKSKYIYSVRSTKSRMQMQGNANVGRGRAKKRQNDKRKSRNGQNCPQTASHIVFCLCLTCTKTTQKPMLAGGYCNAFAFACRLQAKRYVPARAPVPSPASPGPVLSTRRPGQTTQDEDQLPKVREGVLRYARNAHKSIKWHKRISPFTGNRAEKKSTRRKIERKEGGDGCRSCRLRETSRQQARGRSPKSYFPSFILFSFELLSYHNSGPPPSFLNV